MMNSPVLSLPSSRADRIALLKLLNERSRRDSIKSLARFYKDYVWPTVEGGKPFVDNWHIHAIAEHLEAVSAGQIKRLVINIPPRCGKSNLASVAWPAWTWIKKPEKQWLCGSYAEKLAIRDSLRMRRIISSPDYIRDFGDSFKLAGDQNQKVRFQNDKNGHRIAFGMTGGVMGDGGDILLIDDPHDRQGAHSEAERENALTTYDEALVTRLNDLSTSAIVIIMQRLHQNDLSGHVLRQSGWTHLMLPMEYEPKAAKTTGIGFTDPRTKEGEVLDAIRFPRAELALLKASLGEYGTAGQLQQRPSPAGGGILKVDQIRLWPTETPFPDFEFVIQSYDTAFTDKTENDPTAFSAWGVFEHAGRRNVMLLESWSDYLVYPELRKKVMNDWGAKYGGRKMDPLHPARRADVVLVEKKGSGQSLLQDLAQANVPVASYDPGRSDKITRAHMVAPFLDNGVVWVLESRKESGKPVKWARPLVDQMEQFPNGEHDDYVDTFTQAIIYLRDAGQLELAALPDEQPDEIDYHERNPMKHLENVYSL